MERSTPLDKEVLIELGFKYEGDLWFHIQERRFAIKLQSTCFYVSFQSLLTENEKRTFN